MAEGDDKATIAFDAVSNLFGSNADVTESASGSSEPASEGAAAGDTVTETESKSWLQKLTDAVVGVGIGILLVLGTCAGLFWNEGRAVQTARSLAEGGAVVIDVDAAAVDPANEGKLVHVQGALKTTAPLVDPDLLVEAQGARLVRKVEMYQWKEQSRTETHKRVGGGEDRVTTYTYTRVWDDERIDSNRFNRRSGHENPEMRYKEREMLAQDAALGGFRPGPTALHRLPTTLDHRVDEALAGRLKAKFGTTPVQVVDGKVYFAADPAQPRVGDLRITYRLAPPGPASFIARQEGRDLAEYQSEAGDKLLLAAAGEVPASVMFKEAERENMILTWAIRLLGVIFMALGWYLILSPIAVVGDLVPFVGSILDAGAGIVAVLLTAVLAPLVIAMAWLWYRPLVSLGILAAGAVIALGLRHWAKGRAARASTPASRALAQGQARTA